MYTRFSDKLVQSLVSDRQFLTQGMEPCIVFINGEYWGHYELTEKVDKDYVSAHYGIPAKNIYIVKKEALEDGSEETFAEWERLWKWIRDTDFSRQENYEKLCEAPSAFTSPRTETFASVEVSSVGSMPSMIE